jgi:hypothetical protein
MLPRRLGLALGLALALPGCGLLEIGPASNISETEPISARVRVVELGPLDPERVYYPSEAPIVESLPGDRIRLETVVVDTEGLPLADDELDSVWLYCGVGGCQSRDRPFAAPEFDQRCDELDEWTTDSHCRLGEGRGSFEFGVPPLDERGANFGRMTFYAVLAWNGAHAEDCWTARREHGVPPASCGFVQFSGALGPEWWRLAYAESEGLTEPNIAQQYPAPVYGQQANRAPVLDHLTVELGDQTFELEPDEDGVVGPIEVTPGALVRLWVAANEVEQLAQSYFIPLTLELDAFTLHPETLWLRPSTAGPISWVSAQASATQLSVLQPLVLRVDEAAEPGPARVVFALFDDRGAETLAWVELDIR